MLLSLLFPNTEVITIERKVRSEDFAVAQARLRARRNITQLTGDARRLLPKVVRSTDVVLIDGPKDWRAIALAMRLFARQRPPLVFIHDLLSGSPERNFIASRFPEARFSDARVLAEVSSAVDQTIIARLRPHRRLDGFSGSYGYGNGLACIPRNEDRSYLTLWMLAKLNGSLKRVQQYVTKSRI
jgi:hypothetical protein